MDTLCCDVTHHREVPGGPQANGSVLEPAGQHVHVPSLVHIAEGDTPDGDAAVLCGHEASVDRPKSNVVARSCGDRSLLYANVNLKPARSRDLCANCSCRGHVAAREGLKFLGTFKVKKAILKRGLYERGTDDLQPSMGQQRTRANKLLELRFKICKMHC